MRACAAILYVLSCLAKQPDMRAELEAASAVPLLLDLLATCTDTQVQVRMGLCPSQRACMRAHVQL